MSFPIKFNAPEMINDVYFLSFREKSLLKTEKKKKQWGKCGNEWEHKQQKAAPEAPKPRNKMNVNKLSFSYPLFFSFVRGCICRTLVFSCQRRFSAFVEKPLHNHLRLKNLPRDCVPWGRLCRFIYISVMVKRFAAVLINDTLKFKIKQLQKGWILKCSVESYSHNHNQIIFGA